MKILVGGMAWSGWQRLVSLLDPSGADASGPIELETLAGDAAHWSAAALPDDWAEREELLLVGYLSPYEAVARALLDGGDAEQALERWSEEAETIRALLDAAPTRIVLVHVEAAIENAEELTELLSLRTGVKVGLGAATERKRTDDLVFLGLAEGIVEGRREAKARLGVLDDVALINSLQLAPATASDYLRAAGIAASRSSGAREAGGDSVPAATEFLSRENQVLGEALGVLHEDLRAGEGRGNAKGGGILSWLKGLGPVRKVRERLRTRRELALIEESGLFDAAWYLSENADIASQGIDPARHYLLHGAFEGRAASPQFCSAGYLDQHPDVRRIGINPLVHYLNTGRKEGRTIVSADGTVVLEGKEAA